MRTLHQNMVLLLTGVTALAVAACHPQSKPITVDIVVPDDGADNAGFTTGAYTTGASTGASTVEPAPAAVPAAPALEPFTQDLPGTALSFEMIPVAGDGAIAPFWIARTETTWDFYDVFVFELDKTDKSSGEASSGQPEADAITRPSRPYVAPDLGYGHAGYAAISLAYKGATQFCRWLSLKTGRHYRLPTEAEWKLVCERGGVTADTVDAHAWHDGNADYAPHPVGTKAPDALGVADIWGNVREWCTGDDGAPVAMGGGFVDEAADVGCAARAVPTPAWQVTDPQVPKSVWWLSDAGFVGFRVVLVPGDVPAGVAGAAEESEGADK